MKVILGTRIKSIREENGLKQKEVAQKIGISAPMLSHFESGRSKVPADMIPLLSNVLGVSANDLLGVSAFKEILTDEEFRVIKTMRKSEKTRIIINYICDLDKSSK